MVVDSTVVVVAVVVPLYTFRSGQIRRIAVVVAAAVPPCTSCYGQIRRDTNRAWVAGRLAALNCHQVSG